MVNYYETLGVPNYSNYAVVRKAYLKKIKACHPDVNPSADAARQAARYNEAKESLETTLKKERYDDLLRYFMQYGRRPDVTSVPKQYTQKQRAEEIRKQKEAYEKKLHIREMKKYGKSLKRFPLEMRYTILCALDALILFAPTFNTSAPWFLFMIFLFSPHYIVVILATSEYYKQLDYQAYLKKENVNIDLATKKFIWIGFVGGMMLSLIIRLLVT